MAVVAYAVALLAPQRTVARPLPPHATVVDETGAMDSASAEAVRRVAASIRQDGGPSLSLVFVRTLNGELPTEFAKRAYLEWRPGRPERDDGIVCVAAVEERGVACEIGAAVERSVTRDWITNFARERLLPAIGTDRLGPAAVEFTQNVLAAVGGRPALVAEPYRTRVDRTALWAAVGLLAPLAARFAWALVVIVTEAARENRRRKRGGSPRPPLEATPTFVRVELRAAQETPVLQSTIVDPRILVAPLLLVGVFAFALWSRWSDGVERVACSRVSGACVLQHDGDAPLSVPVPILRRVEARTPKDGPALLVGVTTVGNVVFAGRWSPQELAADAETLNGFLSDASRPAWTRTYDHRPDGAFVMKLSAILGPLLLLVVVGARPWRVTANIRRGVVTRTTRVWRRRRPLSSFTAVQVRSALDEKIEKLRRDGGRMPYALLSSARTVRIVLLERSGRSWPITMSTTPAQLALDLETIARRFADAVGVPFVPAAPHPPPGALLGVDLTLLPGAPLQLPVSADDDRRP